MMVLLLLAALVGCGGSGEEEEFVDGRKRNPIVQCDINTERCY